GGGLGVVGKAMVVAARVGEFRLQEQLLARDAALDEGVTDGGFEVVLALVGGVDGAEAGLERQQRQGPGALLLPGGAVQEGRRHGRMLKVVDVYVTETLGSRACAVWPLS